MSDIIELDHKGLRSFGLTTGAIVAVLFGLLIPWLLSDQWPLWPWIVAGALWVPALIFPGALRPVYKIWMKFGAVLGFINTRIILGVFFYVIITPVGAIMRLLGHDPMRRKLDDNHSYRIPSKVNSIKSMERPF